jgi:c-di-GMP-binding flagellar brake protein YcgR
MKEIEKVFVERREWPRVALDALVNEAIIRLPEHPSNQPSAVKIINMSEAGAGILLPHPIERGARVVLGIEGKEVNLSDFQAEIRWAAKKPVSTGQYAAGLKFIELDEERRVQLRSFIRNLRIHGRSGQ